MAINIGTNFAYHGKLPNFDRDKFKTKAAMMAFDENSIDEGHLSYCEEDGNVYQYKSANTVDATTGKWRLFKTEADATLNGTSTNAIQNKAVFEALKTKADAVDLGKYQPKYNADYVAKADFDYSELPNGAEVVDLNGYTMSVSVDKTIIRGEYHNGIIYINSNQVELTGVFYNVHVSFNNDFEYCKINNSNFIGCTVSDISIDDYEGDSSFRNCSINYCVIKSIGCVSFSDLQDCTFAASLGDYAKIENSIIDDVIYNRAVIKDGKPTETGYESNIASPSVSGNAPSCEAVKTALQSKADKTQLNDLATKTELNSKADASALNSYLTKTDAGNTYAKKSDITNIYKFKGTKTNYADLPTTDRVTGDVWNITNADAEHGIKAGDNVAWNGTAWDNLSGTVDLSAYATTTTTDAMSADITSLMNEVFVLTATASVSPNNAEVGTNPTVTLTVDAKLGKGRTQVDEITIDGTKYTGEIPYTHSATATTTHTYNITVKKGTKTANASATINFYNASYYGVVDASKTSLTATEVKALKTKEVKSGRSGTRTFNLTNQKACIAYPKSFGAAASIKDANGFDYLASYTRNEVTIDSVVYYVYLLSSPTTITDFKQIIN